MPAALLPHVQPAISKPRLTRYRQAPGDAPATVLARYLWNISLCEALYPSLHLFEVAFRNSVSQQLVRDYGSTWYQNPQFTGHLSSTRYTQLLDAQTNLTNRRKRISSDGVIAELSLGFWVNLFVGVFHSYWHSDQRLAKAFPHLPPKSDVPFLYPLITTVQTLRNRAFHHEPVFNDPDLLMKYHTARNITRWINPKVHDYLKCSDKFLQVHKDGLRPHLEQIAALTTPQP